jgi:hypothetical protein
MRKIRLALEDLDVQSFATAEAASGRGTVQGAEGPDQDLVGPATVSKPPVCHLESGMCLATRSDDTCDTSYCFSMRCESNDCPVVLDTVFPC